MIQRSISTSVRLGLIACLLLARPSSAVSAQSGFADWTDAQKEAFLRDAEIVEREEIGIGITNSEVVTLDDGQSRHQAQIQTIYEREQFKRFEDGTTEVGFTDYYTHNIAAYRLDRLIGLDMVPVAVPGKDRRLNAAFVWWVDDVQMMELDRHLDGIQPPRPREWVAQVNDDNVFQQLVHNTDPNLGNLIITNDWRLWLIDFTRAFRSHPELRTPEDLRNDVSRHVYDGLKSLTRRMLEDAMDGLLTGAQIDGILARRDLIVAHFDRLIEARGEGLVLR